MKTFAQALCERVGCAREGYLRVALKLCLYPRARFIALVPAFFARAADVQLLTAAGRTSTEEEVRELLREYWDEVHLRGGVLAKRYKLRVSGDQLLKVFGQVMRGEPGPLGG